MVYIGKKIKLMANKLGLKLWVTKREDKHVLNIYCMERDRLLCNYDGYGGNYIRGKFKIMSEEAFKSLPFTVITKQTLINLVKQIHEINEKEKAGNV